METRRLGKSDVEVSVITFGAWAIGGWSWGGADERAAVDAIKSAVDLGVTTIDTAPVYGFGRSEGLVGKAIRGMRDRVQILTKFGLRWDVEAGEHFFDTADRDGRPLRVFRYARPDSVISECEESLRRLGVDTIDLLQIHWPDSTTPIGETMHALSRLMEQGKIRAAGVCNYNVEQMKDAGNVVSLASNQVPYSMVERSIEDEVVPYCLEQEIGILAYSPLQRGLLTGKYGPDHRFKEGDSRPGTPYFKPENRRRVLEFLEKIGPIAQDKGATPAQLVINWTLRRPGITAALVGARDREQVSENAAAVSFKLSDAEMATINRHLQELSLEL